MTLWNNYFSFDVMVTNIYRYDIRHPYCVLAAEMRNYFIYSIFIIVYFNKTIPENNYTTYTKFLLGTRIWCV